MISGPFTQDVQILMVEKCNQFSKKMCSKSVYFFAVLEEVSLFDSMVDFLPSKTRENGPLDLEVLHFQAEILFGIGSMVRIRSRERGCHATVIIRLTK